LQVWASERDLMRSYGATWFQTLINCGFPPPCLHFQRAQDQLDIGHDWRNCCEFFGTPIVGMGCISTEVGRMGLDMVWAEIAVAALVGSAFYGCLSLRALGNLHPSYRR
jgi:NitT/TauT family transport system permease protein